jgi:hypothetical protein
MKNPLLEFVLKIDAVVVAQPVEDYLVPLVEVVKDEEKIDAEIV